MYGDSIESVRCLAMPYSLSYAHKYMRFFRAYSHTTTTTRQTKRNFYFFISFSHFVRAVVGVTWDRVIEMCALSKCWLLSGKYFFVSKWMRFWLVSLHQRTIMRMDHRLCGVSCVKQLPLHCAGPICFRNLLHMKGWIDFRLGNFRCERCVIIVLYFDLCRICLNRYHSF